MEYDDKDQLVRLRIPKGTWERSYDDAGNLVGQKDPLGRETKYVYNAAGMPIKTIDAKGGATSLVYDDAGQLLQYTDCSGKVTKWKYDGDGRLAQSIDAAGNATVYQYGKNGGLSEISSAAGTVRFTHDAEGRLLSQTDPMERVTRFRTTWRGVWQAASMRSAIRFHIAMIVSVA